MLMLYDARVPGVNLNTHNQATLHTSPNCTMPPDQLREPQTGCVLRFLTYGNIEVFNNSMLC